MLYPAERNSNFYLRAEFEFPEKYFVTLYISYDYNWIWDKEIKIDTEEKHYMIDGQNKFNSVQDLKIHLQKVHSIMNEIISHSSYRK